MQQLIAAGMLLVVETVLLEELIKGVCSAGLGVLAGAGLVAFLYSTLYCARTTKAHVDLGLLNMVHVYYVCRISMYIYI